MSNNKCYPAKGGKEETMLILQNCIKDMILDMSDTIETGVSLENVVLNKDSHPWLPPFYIVLSLYPHFWIIYHVYCY